LLSTHILPEVEMTCDRVIIINRGRVAADGLLEDLKERDVSLEDRYLRIVEDEAVRA
jgi:ABC-2 type transport system ATP-binding protein